MSAPAVLGASPLHPVGWPLCAQLEAARALFEAAATSRAAQQWTMNQVAFERVLSPALAARANGADGGSGAVDLRALFAAAAADAREEAESDEEEELEGEEAVAEGEKSD